MTDTPFAEVPPVLSRRAAHPDGAAEDGRLRQLERVWERYVTRGEFDAAIRPSVREAWERCSRLGVSPTRLRRQTFDAGRLRRAQEESRRLLDAVEPFMVAANACLGTRPHVLALLDARAVVIRLVQDGAGDRHHVNLFEGASWAEADIGCNGGGSTVETGRPTIFLGPEHFVDGYLGWTCLGVPLRDPEGVLAGALDFSVPGLATYPGARAWLHAVAGLVEEALCSRGVPTPADVSRVTGLLVNPFAGLRGTLDRLERRSDHDADGGPSLMAELRERIGHAESLFHQAAVELGELQIELEGANERLLVAREEADRRARQAEAARGEAESARAQAELRTRELTALLGNMVEGVLLLDPDGSVLLENESARRISGGVSFARLGSELAAFTPEGRVLGPGETAPARLLAEGALENLEFVVGTPAGDRRRVSCNGSVIRDSAGVVKLGILVVRDVTQLREMEQLRDNFLRMAAHDMRTPLSAIALSAASLGRQGGREGQQVSAVAGRILRNAERLERLLGDMVDTARSDAGRLVLDLKPVRLTKLVSTLVGQMLPQRQRRVRVLPAQGDPLVEADASRLERVLMNLLDNALKYSLPDHPVEVGIGVDSDMAYLIVTDSGHGIAEEDVARVFEPGFRSRLAEDTTDGRGLGLYISRMFVERHGGRILVRSREGHGTSFEVRLPLLPPIARGA